MPSDYEEQPNTDPVDGLKTVGCLLIGIVIMLVIFLGLGKLIQLIR